MEDMKKLFRLLDDYVKGRLSVEENASIKAQIEKDPVLQSMVAIIEDVRDEAVEIDWHKMQGPSHALFDRLLKDVKGQRREPGKKRGVTIFDSGLLPRQEGIRPAEVDTRRLKYLIDDAQLEISIYPISPGSFELIGQITSRDEIKTLSVELRGGKTKLSAEANQYNLFRFPRIPAGTYSLNLLEGRSIIGKIDLEL